MTHFENPSEKRAHEAHSPSVAPDEQPGYEVRIPDFFTGYSTPVGRPKDAAVPSGKRQIPRADLDSNNPCWEESKASLRCLEENKYQQQYCTLYHENYANCRKFWQRVYKDRRKNNQLPWLPPPEERHAVEAHYRQLWNIGNGFNK